MTHSELPPPARLDESTTVIVGGTAGVGLATARALAEAGVPRIVIVGRNQERGETAQQSLSGTASEAIYLSANPIDPADAIRVVARFVSDSAVLRFWSTPPRLR